MHFVELLAHATAFQRWRGSTQAGRDQKNGQADRQWEKMIFHTPNMPMPRLAGNRFWPSAASKLIKTRVKRMNAGFFVSRMGGKPKVITRRKAPFFAVTCQKWCFF
jgi:hypothetical protein